MSIWSEEQARAVLTKVVAQSKADECTATLTGAVRGNIRFALNKVTTSGVVRNVELVVQAAYGKRVGVATINQFDNESLERVVRRAEELARLAPDNEEFMPALDKQTYATTPTYDTSIATITPEYRAGVATASIGPCRAGKAGGRRLFDRRGHHVGARQQQGELRLSEGDQLRLHLHRAHGRRQRLRLGGQQRRRGRHDSTPTSTIRIAIDKAKGSSGAKTLEPGKYTVILEPAAAAGLISPMIFGFDARQADEGRSFLAKKGGGNRLGEKVFDERVSIYADPADADVPVLPWDQEGLPREKTLVRRQGKVASLQYSRYWARQKNATAGRPPPATSSWRAGRSRRRSSSILAQSHPGDADVLHPDGGSADAAADRPDARRHVLHRERQDRVPDQELPVQRIARDHAQQHRGTGQADAGGRRRVSAPNDDPADEAARVHLQFAVGCCVSPIERQPTFLRSSSNQLRMTSRRVGRDSRSVRITRKRWPSAETSNSWR